MGKVHDEPMVSIVPILDFFKIFCPKKTNNAIPSCAASPPRGTGSIAMPRYYLYRGHKHVEVIRHYRKWGMPERRGRRLAGAPKSGNEIFVLRFIELLVDVTIIT